MTHILHSFNTLCNGESWVCLAVKHSHQQLMHLHHVWLPVSRINHQKRINKMCGGRQGYKIFCFVLFSSLLGPKYSFLVKDLIGSRVALLMGCRSKHQLSESSFSGPCCCRAPDADDDWLGRGGEEGEAATRTSHASYRLWEQRIRWQILLVDSFNSWRPSLWGAIRNTTQVPFSWKMRPGLQELKTMRLLWGFS